MKLRADIARNFDGLSKAALEAGAVEDSTNLRGMARRVRGVNALEHAQGVVSEGLRVTRWARQQRLLREREAAAYASTLVEESVVAE